MLPLVQLVRERVAASGLTVRELSRRHSVSYGSLRRYCDTGLRPLAQPPRKSVLQDLARALGVPLSDIEQAADASVERAYSRGERASVPPVLAAIAADPNLTDETRDHLTKQYRLLLRVQAIEAAETLAAAAEMREETGESERAQKLRSVPKEPTK